MTTAPAWLDAGVSRSRILIALIVTLVISDLGEIILREVLRLDVPWWPWAVVGLAVALWIGSRFLEILNPLERYLAVMIVVTAAIALLEVLMSSELWAQLVPTSMQPMLALLASRIVFAGVAVGILGWALVLGASRAEAYARVGDLNAPTRTRRKSGDYLRWRRFGPIAVVFIVLLMIWFTFPRLPDHIDIGAALPFIGIGAVAALLNAFWEEAAFRAAPLSMLQRAVGPGAGVLILALWFGLGHFYGGIPPGPMGLLAAGAIAVLFGRAMIETKGLGWPVILHFSGDLVIFTILAIASVG